VTGPVTLICVAKNWSPLGMSHAVAGAPMYPVSVQNGTLNELITMPV